MTQASAPMSPAIKVVTGLVLAMIAALFLAAGKICGMLLGSALLSIVALFCYLYAPVAYELTGDQLTVRFRLGQKVFQGVTGCETLTTRPPGGCASGATAGSLPPRGFSGIRPTASIEPILPVPATRTMSWWPPGPGRS